MQNRTGLRILPRVVVVLLAVAAAIGVAPMAIGQAVFGSIAGLVTDTTGAAIPNANIVVTDVDKGTSVTLQSNGAGEFTADHLIPDIYNIKVSVTGFKSFEQDQLTIFADTTSKVTATLQAGAADQTVTVNADDVPQLKTDRADVATEFNSKEIVDLPIPDRNFTNLQLLLPGAQLLGWSHAADENPQGSKQIEVDGQAFAGVAFQLDGTDNQDPILGIIVINPNADSLSETKITTQNFDAEFGKAVSSVVTAQTKSGSNAFHGSAFDYRESSANLGRDPFSQSTTSSVPAAIKSQFGGSVGGPILKDRLFFFGDYQGVRQKVGYSNVQTVPSAYLVSTCLGKTTPANGIAGCDFSEYATALGIPQLVYQQVPQSGDTAQPGRPRGQQAGATVSVPYPGNVIPTADLSPQALALLTLLAPYAPNTTGSLNGLKNNYAGNGNGLFNSNQWDARGDYTLNAKTHVFGRFSRFTDTLSGAVMFGPAGGAGFGLGGYGGSSLGANDSAAAGVDVALSSKLSTDVRLGYFRYNINTAKYDEGTDEATVLGIPGENTGDPITSGAPGFNLTEVGSFGGPNNSADSGPTYGAGLNINRCNCPLREHEDQFQLANNWTRIIGNHSIKFGADLRYARNLRVPSDSDRTGLMNFGTGPTGDVNNLGATGLGFASFLVGDVTQYQRYVSTSTDAKEFQKRDFFYAQDTWRASQKLTLNLGLRYEIYFPESVNGVSNGALLNPATGYLQVAGVGGVGLNMNYKTAPNTYNPRIGVAYQALPGTVIRAGYGRSFDIGVFGSIFGHAATQNLPVLQNQQVTTSGTDAAFTLASGPPAPTPVAVPSSGLLPNPGYAVSSRERPTTLRLPTLDAWNVSVQQSLTPTLSLTIAYVANKGTHTFGDQSGNTTNPNEDAIFLPASLSFTGAPLHYDPSAGNGVAADGGTGNGNYLRRYYGGTLPACSDQNYINAAASAGVTLPANGGCGWTDDLQFYGDNLDTHYDALQVSLAKQFGHGYSVNVNYAWQKATDDATGYSSWDKSVVYGRAGDLRQQQIIVYGLFELPMGRNKLFLGNSNRVVNSIVSGIQISPVVNYSSGLPFTLSYSGCRSQVPGDAPCQVNGDPGALHEHVTGYPGNGLSFYDPVTLAPGSPFSAPGLDQIGDVGRNSAYGPHFFTTDISLQKNFTIREKYTFQVRADGFNAFNHINFATPNGNIDQGGSIGGGPFPNGSDPRQLQFSARIQF